MKTKRQIVIIGIAAGLLIAGILLSLYQPWRQIGSAEDFEISDFDAVHAPVDQDANEYLIFGNLPVPSPAANLPSELAVFLGRWEGYDYSPPVKKDYKFVLVIQEITAQGGRAFLWMGTNLQYPSAVEEIHFETLPGTTPVIAFETHFGNKKQTLELAYARDQDTLSSTAGSPRAIELGRSKTFHVYKDYAAYLAGKRIFPREYRNDRLPRYYGPGYLLYLPEGYEADEEKTWPLLFFLHGYGDRGDNLLLLPKASPFMMIREKGPLPFIIVAPLLSTSHQDYSAFPDNYMNEALDEILADYRVDRKRIYLTGLSMGGEATYRFAINQPDTFAAIAPLCAYLSSSLSVESIKDLPVWAIHGADDTVVPLSQGRRPVEALQEAGGDVRFTVLEGHDHDVWTDTYSDPAFYDWLLQHQRPK